MDRNMVNATSRGALVSKTLIKVRALFNFMAWNTQ